MSGNTYADEEVLALTVQLTSIREEQQAQFRAAHDTMTAAISWRNRTRPGYERHKAATADKKIHVATLTRIVKDVQDANAPSSTTAPTVITTLADEIAQDLPKMLLCEEGAKLARMTLKLHKHEKKRFRRDYTVVMAQLMIQHGSEHNTMIKELEKQILAVRFRAGGICEDGTSPWGPRRTGVII